MKIAICDDDKDMLKLMHDRVSAVMEENKAEYTIKEFSDGKALVEHCVENKTDAVLIDVDMPGMDGFEVVEKLQEHDHDILIVFVTGHEDKVYQSWEFHPFWFVRKSHLKDLDIVLPRLVEKINSLREKEHFVIDFITENKAVALDINKTKYIQAHKHYVIIKYSDGEEMQIRCKISEVEKQLSPLYFVRVQNGAVINCRFIEKITSRDVVLSGGEKIHISRDRQDYVRNIFQEFIRSKKL